MQRLPFDITELWKDPLKLANTPRPANRRSTSNLGDNFGVGEPAFRQAVVIKNGGRRRYEQSILGALKSLFSFPPPWLILLMPVYSMCDAPCPGYFCSLFWPGKPDSLITFISLHCKVMLIQIKYLTLLKFRVCATLELWLQSHWRLGLNLNVVTLVLQSRNGGVGWNFA